LGPAGGAKIVFTADLPKLVTRFADEKLPGKAVVHDLDRIKRTSSALKPVLSPPPVADPEPLALPNSLTEVRLPTAGRKRRNSALAASSSCPSLDSLKRLCSESFAASPLPILDDKLQESEDSQEEVEMIKFQSDDL
jgi:hypothetical protein